MMNSSPLFVMLRLRAGYDVNWQSEHNGEMAWFVPFHLQLEEDANRLQTRVTILLDHGAARSYRSHLEVDAPEIHPTDELEQASALYDLTHPAPAVAASEAAPAEGVISADPCDSPPAASFENADAPRASSTICTGGTRSCMLSS
jgi:hypothetical protein